MGTRDGPRIAWDPINKRMNVFGGVCSGNLCPSATVFYWNSVAQFDAGTGDNCMSDGGDTTHGSANTTNTAATWCPLPALSGTPPPQSLTVDIGCGPTAGTQNCILKFPDFTYDSNAAITRMLFYGGNQGSTGDGIWGYDPTGNNWTHYATANGPVIDVKDFTSHQNWNYDSTDGVTVWITGGAVNALWQLPDGPIGGTAPTTATLTVTIAGTGTGSTSDGNGFTCGSGTCAHTYNIGTNVTLTASAVGNSSFAGWSGDCSGTNLCVLSMSVNHSVTATFNPPVKTVQDLTFRGGPTVKQ